MIGNLDRRSPHPRRRETDKAGLALAIVRSVLATRQAEFNLAVLTQRMNDAEAPPDFTEYPGQKRASTRRVVEASVIQGSNEIASGRRKASMPTKCIAHTPLPRVSAPAASQPAAARLPRFAVTRAPMSSARCAASTAITTDRITRNTS